MPIMYSREVFVQLLSNLRQGSAPTARIFQEISEAALDPEIQEALAARVFMSDEINARLDQCFKLIGEKPVQASGFLYDAFAEDIRRQLAEIQNPVAWHLFILSKATHLIHVRIAEYVALIAAADVTDNYSVGVVLERLLADKLALVEQIRCLIRKVVESKVFENASENALKRPAA
jgi:ferritin-like metal-binding protein YciE